MLRKCCPQVRVSYTSPNLNAFVDCWHGKTPRALTHMSVWIMLVWVDRRVCMKGLQALAFGKCPAQFREATQLGTRLDFQGSPAPSPFPGARLWSFFLRTWGERIYTNMAEMFVSISFTPKHPCPCPHWSARDSVLLKEVWDIEMFTPSDASRQISSS